MANFSLDFNKILNRLILFIAIGVVVHIVFVLSTTQSSALSLLSKISIWHILGVLVCMILPWMGTAARMVVWSRFLKEKIRYGEAVRVVVISEVASALSPTAVGGTPIRAAMLLNRGFDKGNIGFILTYSIVEDLIFYATGVFLAVFFAPEIINQLGSQLQLFFQANFVYILAISVIIFGVVWIVRLLRRRKKNAAPIAKTSWRTKINETLSSMLKNFGLAWRNGKGSILVSLAILFMQWMAKLTILVILFDAFGVNMEAMTIYIKQWLTYVVMLFVPTPGASGGAEASFLLMFKQSVPSDIAFLIVSTWRLFTYYFILLLAVLFYVVLTYGFGFKEEVVVDS